MKRLVALGSLALGLLAPAASEAVLRLASSIDGGGTITAIDNQIVNTCPTPLVGPCQVPDIDPALGTLTLASSTAAGGDLLINVSVQTQTIGGFNRLDSTGTQVTNLSTITAHEFAVAIGATDFIGPVDLATATGAGQWSTLSGQYGPTTITMRWYDDPANQQGALTASALQPGILIDSFSHTPSLNPESFAHNAQLAVSDPSLFAMTVQFDGILGPQVRLTGREQTEIKELRAVRNAGTWWLMSMGVALVLGMLGCRRRSA
jgi:hypothetical protein